MLYVRKTSTSCLLVSIAQEKWHYYNKLEIWNIFISNMILNKCRLFQYYVNSFNLAGNMYVCRDKSKLGTCLLIYENDILAILIAYTLFDDDCLDVMM